MISIQTKIESGAEIPKKQIENLQNRAQKLNTTVSNSSMILAGLITSNLNSRIGSKSRHFDVNISPHGGGVKISVSSSDEVGKFIYYGTKAHTIESGNTSMPMPDGGFADSVEHPGTHPMKPEIDAAVHDAMYKMRSIMRWS